MDTFDVLTRDLRHQLAEGPLWCERENALYWVDIMGPAVHRLALDEGPVRSWPMPETIGWVVERRAQTGFIAGFADGFAELTLDPMSITAIGDPEPELPNNRMNDAKVDRAGRIWAGTMDTDASTPSGSLYRLDADHTWHRMDTGYLVTNGPTFSPDGRTLYHTDSLRRVIYRFELHPDGELANKIPFITFDADAGLPDGMTMDIEGGLWVAHWGAGCVSRFTPDGRMDRRVQLPISQPTSCVFAGAHLERMFVTSAACDRPEEKLAGELFEIDPGICGIPANQFVG